MDTRRRISFNMNTGGGLPSEPSTGGTYTVNLNGQWEKTTAISNPDSTLYDGVYRSSSNYNVDSGVATMYVDISGMSEFTLYIRSYAESSYDYVMVSQLDKTITSGSSTTDTTLVKAHTKSNQKSGATISDYTEVKYTNIDGGSHRITIMYRKDSSVNNGDDRGYVLVSKSNGSSDSGGGTPDNPGTGGDISGPINTSNYMTILALENGLTASLSTNACQYCIDGDGNWIDLSAGTTTQAINSGQTLSFRGNLTPNSSSGIGRFTINKKCNLEGNCMSLLFGDNVVNNNSLSGKDYAFRTLFSGCTTIIQVSKTFLPATTLAKGCYYSMFHGCSNLTVTPELPATTLADMCYSNMFYYCNKLTTAPELPATTLASSCYENMFYGCSKLTTAPELPATTLADGCYISMFYNCRSLTTAPVLPATTLASQCYSNMFSNCSGLATAPELPVTTLASGCYNAMFVDCTSLTVAPELPATTLVEYCYSNMFYGCSKLTTAPELPATTLANSCYNYMFYDCTSLTVAPELPATTLALSCYSSMFRGCTSLISAPELPATTLAGSCYFNMFNGTNVLPDCSNINFSNSAIVSSGGLAGLFAGTKVTDADLFNILPINSSTGKYWLPVTTLTITCYQSMFQGCKSLVTAPELPATKLAERCYQYMFQSCTSLVTAPELPATNLNNQCYDYMFQGCSSLVNVPSVLPATTLSSYCYEHMFRGCTSLVTAPELPATKLTIQCYYSMFEGCKKLNYIKMLATNISASSCLANWVSNVSNTGTFVKNPAMTSLPTGSSGIPSGWTVVDDN